MQRKDYYVLGILYLIVLLVFYPVFYTDYVYMDEALEIWGFKPGTGFIMFLDDGRILTEWLQSPLFHRADTIHDITYIRIISLLGWLLCLPVWYVVIKRCMVNMQNYENLPFFACLYLVTSLPFIISIQWATCMQFFIAQTLGLLSGAIAYNGMQFNANRIRISPVAVPVALLSGVASMFFYQSAIGCFLIPYVLFFINPKTAQKGKVLFSGLAVYCLIYLTYYVLYKFSMNAFDIAPISRNTIRIDVWDKVKWFLARPLERSFRFSIMTHEDSLLSKYYYALMLIGWAVLSFMRFGKTRVWHALTYLAVTAGIFAASYLPNLIIKENFASNRTLLALDMCVWLVVVELFLFFVKNKLWIQVTAVIVGLIFMIAARNNFRNGFLRPVRQETAALKTYIHQHFHGGIRRVHFIRPPEDFFVTRYKVYQSMDEFGVPQSFFSWVPDPLTRQLVYEKTQDREQAERLVIQQWADKRSYERSGAVPDSTVLIVDVQAIMTGAKP